MNRRGLSAVGLALVAVCAWAQNEGIGDPTFPRLGNLGYKAKHYSLKINYNPSTNLMRGDVTMTAVAVNDLDTFSVDFSGFDIAALKLNGKTASYERRTPGKLHVFCGIIKAGQTFKLETVYAGKPFQQQSAALPPGMKSGWIAYAGGAVAVCEPDMAHTWFPCNDHPLNKATFDVDLTVPSPYVGISNGTATKVTATTTHFVMDKPAMTCMVTVAVGKYGVVKQRGPKDLPITNYVPLGSEMRFMQPLEISGKFMQYLSDRIGPYPFDTYGTIILPKEVADVSAIMSGSAIETTSIPVFGPNGAGNPDVLCHELTHQWMGDCVSITNWGDDIWWVEGFAQYSEWLLTELTQGKAAYDKEVKSNYDMFAGQAHWLKPGHLAAADMFGAGSYIGGALTFHALRKKLGDAKFFETVREFVAKNRYGNASVKDWVEVASKVAGEDMKPFFDTWLYGDAAPKLPN